MMKKILCALALITLSGCSACPCHDKMTATSAIPKSAPCATATVSGMSCEACAITVTQNVKKVKGVTDVKVDVTAGKVFITSASDARVSHSDIQTMIDKSGYTLQSFQPSCI